MKKHVSETTTSNDGINISYEHVGIGNPAIVFVHGWCCNKSYWREQMEHFSESHFVVAIDLAGHGYSDSNRRQWTMSAYGEDVCAVVNALGLTDIVLIGHSLGAIVIVEAYKSLLMRTRGLVAVEFFENANQQLTDSEIEVSVAPMRDNFRRSVETLVRGYFPSTARPELVDWVARDMASASPTTAIPTLIQSRQYHKGRGLQAVKVPMWLLNADLWPTDLAAARAFKSDIQLHILNGLGHFVMLEDSTVFNKALADVIARLKNR
jgi:pimeloyl-ACP methyl ester carboxylesterase